MYALLLPITSMIRGAGVPAANVQQLRAGCRFYRSSRTSPLVLLRSISTGIATPR